MGAYLACTPGIPSQRRIALDDLTPIVSEEDDFTTSSDTLKQQGYLLDFAFYRTDLFRLPTSICSQTKNLGEVTAAVTHETCWLGRWDFGDA